MTAVECQGVRLDRGGRAVLSGVDLCIGAREFVGVLGPNGAGKTTFMRAILGLERPAAGRLAVLGNPARRGNPRIGYVPQLRASTAASRLRGWDMVAGAVNGHRPGLPILSRAGRLEVERALALVDSTATAQRPLGELSGGERQRLLLAQALIGQPQLLLLDEPLAGLDPRHQRAAVALAHDLGEALGIAVLFSAHDLNHLLGVVDRVLYLGGGHAVIGPAADVVTGPVLSRLYQAPMEVVRTGDRVFVLPGADTHV